MRRLLDRLPERERAALLLQLDDELSIEEIARLLGTTAAAAYSLLGRGRAALFRLGKEYFAG